MILGYIISKANIFLRCWHYDNFLFGIKIKIEKEFESA